MKVRLIVFIVLCSSLGATRAFAQVAEDGPDTLFFTTDARNAIWMTRYDAPDKKFADPAVWRSAPKVSIGGSISTYPIMSFSVFRRVSEKRCRVFSASTLDFFEHDVNNWERRGALGGNSTNVIHSSVCDAQERYWMSGNSTPSGTFEYFNADTVRRTGGVNCSQGSGLTVKQFKDDRLLMFNSGGATSTLLVFKSSKDVVEWKQLSPLNPHDVVIKGDATPLDQKLSPLFTSIDVLNGSMDDPLVTIGWTHLANPGLGFKTRFVRCKFVDLLNRAPHAKLSVDEVAPENESQLTGMTVLESGDIIGSFYGGEIRNVTAKVPPLKIVPEVGYVLWIQRATLTGRGDEASQQQMK